MICDRCSKREALETHHIDGNHDNNIPENLTEVCGFCHSELHYIQPNLVEAKIQYENLKDLENSRVRIENRIRGLKEKWGINTEFLEEELKIVSTFEKKTEKKLVEIVKDREIFKWLISIKGIAGKTAAELIALIGDIEKSDSISSLWHYAGLHVDEGKASRPRKGKKINYKPKLKSLCLGIIGQNFLRSKSLYRYFYDKKKIYYGTNREWTKNHRHKAAVRYMVKMFLKDLWLKWREYEKLPITERHLRDQPSVIMKTTTITRHLAAVGDRTSGRTQELSGTRTQDMSPAGSRFSEPTNGKIEQKMSKEVK